MLSDGYSAPGSLWALGSIYAAVRFAYHRRSLSPFASPLSTRPIFFPLQLYISLHWSVSCYFVRFEVFKILKITCVCVCGFIHVSAVSVEARRGRQALELQAVVNCLKHMATELLFPGGGMYVLNCWDMFPALDWVFSDRVFFLKPVGLKFTKQPKLAWNPRQPPTQPPAAEFWSRGVREEGGDCLASNLLAL